MEGISKSQVSRLCGEIDGRVQAFLTRPIEGDWPYVWLDATYVKARRDGHIVSVAVIIAVGANTDGRREVLGMTIGNSKAEPFWTEFLRSLTRRGLRGVKLVVSDAHEGLRTAVKQDPRRRPGKDVACISCAMPWRMRARRSAASSRPGSARRSPRPTHPGPRRSGARSPTSSVPVCPGLPP